PWQGRMAAHFLAAAPSLGVSRCRAYASRRACIRSRSCRHEMKAGSMEDRWVEIYDTTLRDGAQGEGLAYSVEDKLKIAICLDELGVSYIEGGWPGSNPKDVEFFERAKGV